MNKKLLTAEIVGMLCLFSCSGTKPGEESSRNLPNVLFIAVDDLKTTLGSYGDSVVQTPNIDSLSRKGIRFMNNHCQVAVCGPSRASLLTGMYPDESGIWGFDNIREKVPEVITLPQFFRENGYTTVNISKIFDQRTVDQYWDSLSWTSSFPLSEEDLIPYFSEETGPVSCYFYQSEKVKNMFDSLAPIAKEKELHPIRYTQGFIKPATEALDMPDDAYKDGVFAKKAMMDLERLAKEGNPFFLAVGFERPHLPWTAPKKYWDLYERQSLPLAEFRTFAENDEPWFYHTSNELRSYTDENGNQIYARLEHGIPLLDSEQRKLIHGYLAAVSYIDAQIGKILQKLDELKLEENTIIVLWGDHGWHLGDHGIWGKSTNFEQATHAPMIFRVPWMDPHVVNKPTEFVDIYPTLCALAGMEVPSHLRGDNLIPLMENTDESDFPYAFSQFSRDEKMGYAIRSDRYRYVEWMEKGKHYDSGADYSKVVEKQLFDYQTDPHERVNVANTPGYEKIRQELEEALHEWLIQFSANS